MTRSTLRRGLAAAKSALVLVLAASACSSGSQSASRTESEVKPTISPVAAIRKAAEASENTTSKFTSDIKATMSGGSASNPLGDGFSMRMRGAVDPTAKVADMHMTVTDPSGQDVTIRQIMTADAMYMSGAMFPPGKWVKVSLDGSSPLAKAFEGGMTDTGKIFGALTGGSGLKRVGTEQVRGDETTHYRGTIDVEKALDAMGKQMAQQLQQIGTVDDAPFDVWIDGDNRVRKLEEVITIRGKQGEKLRMHINMEMFDYGTQVKVTPPPAKNVIEQPQG